MKSLKDNKLFYALLIASAMCFIGHGSFGIITKELWTHYFAVFGIGHDMAYRSMPWLGAVDILLGLSLLVYPTRSVLLWLVIWGTLTAMLRPLSGEPFAEFIERAGNFGAPLTLLILCREQGSLFRRQFSRLTPPARVDEQTLNKVTNCLRVVVFLLLTGHGWLNVVEKKGIMGQYAALGFSNPATVGHFVGMFEIAAACLLLVRPLRPIIFTLLIWKMGTELFYPHWEAFEWIERGGSYGVLLALWLVLPQSKLWRRQLVQTA